MLGKYVMMDRASGLCSRALIGRLEYCTLKKEEWVEWDTTHWKFILNYIPTIILLANRWLVFIFIEDSNATRILNSLWTIENGSLVLSRWHSSFDLLRERVVKRHFWVRMPTLPFPLWNKEFLIGISNTLGHFVAIEKYSQAYF